MSPVMFLHGLIGGVATFPLTSGLLLLAIVVIRFDRSWPSWLLLVGAAAAFTAISADFLWVLAAERGWLQRTGLLEGDGKPESVSIIDVPSQRRDYGSNIGNIKVRFSDGHSEVWTSLGRCIYAYVSPTGLVGWTRYTSRNDYAKPVNSILRVRFLSGRIKDFEAYPYIEEWGFADNDSAVIIKARGRDAPAYYVKYSLGTGKLVESVACTPKDQLPKWAQPYAD
jgi:hypothetical protein